MPPKAKHKVSMLAKAIKTHRHSTNPPSSETSKVCLDIRKASTAAEFSLADLGLDAAKKTPSKSTAQTSLAGESTINVERRVRNAAVPLHGDVDDAANVSEELSIEGFEFSSVTRSLMPRRPAWSFEISSGRLHHREVQGFKQWLADVRQLIEDRGGYPPAFEQNLQVWRQLWRVLERCSVAVVVVDVRHPLLHLPPALVYHISLTLRKPLVIVLNKLDTVEPSSAARWGACLRQGIPGISGVVGYSKEFLESLAYGDLQVGKSSLIEACHRVVSEAALSKAVSGCCPVPEERAGVGSPEDGRIMLGIVGHPNVGKSSLINSLMGGKAVSVKATPGHTKTLQTLFLDERTCLCDSPGIVFPRLDVPREAQIVGALIPLAQVREPFSALRWVMERMPAPLPDMLGIKPVTLQEALELRDAGVEALGLDEVSDEAELMPWSPLLLCARYAKQRGFMKGGTPDCLQAGTQILQRVLDGRVPYSVRPPTSFAPGSLRQDAAADSDSDWQIDDGDYESEPEEEDPASGKSSLFEVFGMEPRGPGSGSIHSRKKQRKRREREAAEAAAGGGEGT